MDIFHLVPRYTLILYPSLQLNSGNYLVSGAWFLVLSLLMHVICMQILREMKVDAPMWLFPRSKNLKDVKIFLRESESPYNQLPWVH